MSGPQPTRTAVGAWVTYDVANSLFWAGIVGLSFPLWLTKELSGNDATLGYTISATMAVVLLSAPILGAISDQLGRRMPLLIATTLVCVGATLLLGYGGLVISLVLFASALCAMELGTIFYNALLPEVSTPANRGLVSGMGQGIGYLGAGIAVGVAFVLTEPRGYVFVFHVVALLFLLFSLPVFLLLRERRRPVPPSSVLRKVIQGFSQLSGNLRGLHRFPGLRTFLAARFLYAMGVNTAVAFAVVYASRTIGLSDREIQLVLLAGITVAIPSGVLWGALCDRIGPNLVLSSALLLWLVLLLLAVAIAWLSWSTHLWWGVGCLTGIAMAAIWTADRPYMLSFTPPQYLGEFFGLHGMVGKSGRVIGPAMWGLISGTLGFGQPVAVLSLVGCLVASYVILGRLRAPVRAARSTEPVGQSGLGDGS